MDTIAETIISSTIFEILKVAFIQIVNREDSRQLDTLKDIEKKVNFTEIASQAAAYKKDIKLLTLHVPEKEVDEFLRLPEIEAVVRQIYAESFLNACSGLDLIKKEFYELYRLHTGIDESKAHSDAEILFHILIEGCQEILRQLVENNSVAAHEAGSILRHKILIDEISNIRLNLDLLTKKDLNIPEILRFEREYRQQVANRHGFIRPPHFNEGRRIPIDKLYVSPDLIQIRRKHLPINSLKSFVSNTYRAVVLGDPGGGKSTLAQKVCFEIASERLLLGGRKVTPIIIVLRDYGAKKKNDNCSILDFINITSNSTYQRAAYDGAFEYLLLNGRAMVIFDGLDELLDTSDRRDISQDVEAFCRQYPAVPVIVTSREVGYNQAPLDEAMFETYRLSGFGSHQIEEYVTKWFDINTDLTPDDKRQKTKNFIAESQIIPDLRSNPLMLALLCNIYKGENYIPRNRPSIYRKCADMLFEQWDKSRGIVEKLPFHDAYIRPAMQQLAFWIYSDTTLQKGVGEERLIEKASQYLKVKCFETIEEAEYAAKQFIQFCSGRAWVFTDVGVTPNGERIFQFTHRTFLEYFSAEYLVRNHSTNELIEILQPRIMKAEWDVVAQLSIQLAEQYQEGAADKILSQLSSEAENLTEGQGWSLVSFVTRCLGFIVPPPNVRKQVAMLCLRKSLELGKDLANSKLREGLYASRLTEPRDTLVKLLNVDHENLKTISEITEAFLISTINSIRDKTMQEVALEITLSLSRMLAPHQFVIPIVREEVLTVWTEVKGRVLETCRESILGIIAQSLPLSVDAYFTDIISLEQLIELHGPSSVFRHRQYILSPGTYLPPLSEVFFQNITRHLNKDEKLLKGSSELGDLLIDYPPPWYSPDRKLLLEREGFGSGFWQGDSIPLEKIYGLTKNTLFTLFIVVAASIEGLPEDRVQNVIHHQKNAIWNIFTPFLENRYLGNKVNLEVELDNFGFSEKQRLFITDWVENTKSILKKATD
jgi:hypothetical protein